ncbi:DNA polymerase III subunit gamma/tau [Pasteurellaceae bacterium 15-036681]|nr:DNA polymerase III subunit gamma/tau [Pasteurellaceae bacterium 15-036681]
MSYQVLARKWRPQRFSEVVGQQHVLSALENGLREGRLHHAYLFSGTRGVGKTSIARLFAKGLNCETGITSTPCGECANCKAIEEGRFIDLIEIDAASRTKVEDTRELLDNVQYKPTVGRFKVYLIDEVHMLSRHSFNALLKTLEEPPEYVKFLLATTDPQKLPITILSRCMQFHLRALDQSQIRDHLEFILKQEQIPYEINALEKLAKAAQGSIRDSLSLTDQAIAVSNANVTLPIASQMLGLIDDHQPLELVQAIALADGEKAIKVIQSVAEKGVDWQQLLSDVAETLHQIAMVQLLPHSHQEETPLHYLARQLPPEDVQFFYQLILAGKKELMYAPEPRIGVEMTILRALAFHPKNADKIVTPAAMQQQSQPQPAQPSATQQGIAQLRERLTQNQAKSASIATSATTQQVVTAQAVSSEPKIANQSAVAEPQFTPPSPPPMPSVTAEVATSSGMSAAMLAMSARKGLKDKQATQDEKKKSELALPKINATSRSSKKETVLDRFASLADRSISNEVQQQTTTATNQAAAQADDEDYRWTWLDPELEKESEVAKPSDIKQAILQERTPDIVRKTIELANQQDEWSMLISTLRLGGLTRQLALNSYLLDKKENELHLELRQGFAHFDNESSRQALQTALAEKALSYTLSQGNSEQHKTPLELRRDVYEQLTQSAKQALLADEKLKLLRNAFDAQLDESTIRAVAE